MNNTNRALKTKVIELPTWDQLTAEERIKVLDNHCDINTDHDWWSFTYEDAKNVGIKITTFDLDRQYIHCQHNNGMHEIAAKVIKDHGENCDTYKIAVDFLKAYDEASSYSLNFYSEWFEKFSKAYLNMLQNEYDCLVGDDAIRNTLTSNDYTFNRETLKIDS